MHEEPFSSSETQRLISNINFPRILLVFRLLILVKYRASRCFSFHEVVRVACQSHSCFILYAPGLKQCNNISNAMCFLSSKTLIPQFTVTNIPFMLPLKQLVVSGLPAKPFKSFCDRTQRIGSVAGINK